MKTELIATDQIYQQLLDTTNPDERRQLFIDQLIQPWQSMMSMVVPPGGADQVDPLAGAKAWNWLLPDQVEEMADLLGRLRAADAWNIGRDALACAAGRFSAQEARLPIQEVTGWLVLADPARSNPLESGYTGAIDWMQPRFIGQFWDPNPDNLPRLAGLVAHEMHHLIRLRLFPWDMRGTSVADYIVIEGTAEAFAVSLFGEDKVGWFITQFNDSDFETARSLIKDGLKATGFDTIRGYIFGDALAQRSGFRPVGGMPAYGGYTVGYRVVRSFMERTGSTIEETTFLPASEIVHGSGFFS